MQKMKKIDRDQWTAKTLRVNADRILKIGDEVVDVYKNKGIVVKIVPGVSDEDHGAVYVWQSERMEYGSDNCEHYVEFGWKLLLRVLE